MKNKYLHHAHITERKFREILRCFGRDIPAMTTASLLSIRRPTVQRIYSLLRARIALLTREELRAFSGEIEVDESSFGPQRIRGKKGRAAGQKIPVLGLHKRGDKVFLSIVKNCSMQELMPILRGNILSESDVYTDGWAAYDGLVSDGYKHHRVFHQKNEFARGKNHVNGIESFWSFAKMRMSKLRGIRKDKFLLHLKECEWRWNHRHQNLYSILLHDLRAFPL